MPWGYWKYSSKNHLKLFIFNCFRSNLTMVISSYFTRIAVYVLSRQVSFYLPPNSLLCYFIYTLMSYCTKHFLTFCKKTCHEEPNRNFIPSALSLTLTLLQYCVVSLYSQPPSLLLQKLIHFLLPHKLISYLRWIHPFFPSFISSLPCSPVRSLG